VAIVARQVANNPALGCTAAECTAPDQFRAIDKKGSSRIASAQVNSVTSTGSTFGVSDGLIRRAHFLTRRSYYCPESVRSPILSHISLPNRLISI
jgi:hypothetical protein